MIKKFVDVERIIASKNEKLLKRLPKFVVAYLKRILHQDEINQIIHENQQLHNEEFCNEIVTRFNLQIQSHGTENIPLTGGIIFVVNHPLGGMDAMALVSEFSKYRTDIKFIVNDILLTLENLKGLFIGVNKHGSSAKQSLKDVDSLFSSDQAIFVFPAGMVSRKMGKQIVDLEWKKTFVTQSIKYNKTVIPVFLEGRLSPFFYRISNLRQLLGIKANLEMLFLVNELFKQRNKSILITFGKAISSTTFDSSKNHKEWAAWVKEQVYKLQELHD